MKAYKILVLICVVVSIILVVHLLTRKTTEERKEEFKINCDKLFGNNNTDLRCTKTKCACYPISCIAENMTISYTACQQYGDD